MKIPTILEHSDMTSSVCSFWRARGVLNELSKEGHVNIIESDWNSSWDKARSCDIAFFQRPMSEKCLNEVMTCKDLGLKIWIDLDDSNQIPPWHEVYDLWCKEYNEKSFQKIMLLADIVTVSTKYLKDYYLKYSNNVMVVPNAINDYWLPFNGKSKNKIVCWRGGKHHLPDIYEYKDQVIEVMQKHKEWKFCCVGSEVEFLKGHINNYEYSGDFDIHKYFAFIIRNAPSVFIVPLAKNELNKAKSNISWQEATLAGGVALVPEYWNLYRKAMVYDDKESFGYQLDRLIINEKLRTDLYEKSLKEVKQKYILSKTNKQRLEIINKLIS